MTLTARVSTQSQGSDYFYLAFDDTPGNFLQVPGISPGTPHSETYPLLPTLVPLGTATTDVNGAYQFSLTAQGTRPIELQATYAGDSTHWPDAIRVGP